MNTVPAAIPLPFAGPGEPVRITGIGHGRDLEKRLAAMGLTLGSELCLMQQEGGNLVVAVGNTRLALGHGLAQKILVTPI
ncbi:MAG: ferrous iron transport protein A [Zoogloeaceae bacterium]|jgi:Fe2+ transport system protein FeoA|nr:ferrous iron transport protein A [Zoogloeaceae bacterium]